PPSPPRLPTLSTPTHKGPQAKEQHTSCEPSQYKGDRRTAKSRSHGTVVVEAVQRWNRIERRARCGMGEVSCLDRGECVDVDYWECGGHACPERGGIRAREGLLVRT